MLGHINRDSFTVTCSHSCEHTFSIKQDHVYSVACFFSLSNIPWAFLSMSIITDLNNHIKCYAGFPLIDIPNVFCYSYAVDYIGQFPYLSIISEPAPSTQQHAYPIMTLLPPVKQNNPPAVLLPNPLWSQLPLGVAGHTASCRPSCCKCRASDDRGDTPCAICQEQEDRCL